MNLHRSAALVSLVVSASAASAAPFRPFSDAVGVTAEGAIVTTTRYSHGGGRSDLVVFGADGAASAVTRLYEPSGSRRTWAARVTAARDGMRKPGR